MVGQKSPKSFPTDGKTFVVLKGPHKGMHVESVGRVEGHEGKHIVKSLVGNDMFEMGGAWLAKPGEEFDIFADA